MKEGDAELEEDEEEDGVDEVEAEEEEQIQEEKEREERNDGLLAVVSVQGGTELGWKEGSIIG